MSSQHKYLHFNSKSGAFGAVKSYLQEPMKLHGDNWEVALTDFMAPRKFVNVDEDSRIIFYCQISFDDGQTLSGIKEFAADTQIRDDMTTKNLHWGFPILITLKKGHYASCQEICDSVNTTFKSALEDFLMSKPTLRTAMATQYFDLKIISSMSDYEVRVLDSLSAYLNIQTRETGDSILRMQNPKQFILFQYDEMEQRVAIGASEKWRATKDNQYNYCVECVAIIVENTSVMSKLGLVHSSAIVTNEWRSLKEKLFDLNYFKNAPRSILANFFRLHELAFSTDGKNFGALVKPTSPDSQSSVTVSRHFWKSWQQGRANAEKYSDGRLEIRLRQKGLFTTYYSVRQTIDNYNNSLDEILFHTICTLRPDLKAYLITTFKYTDTGHINVRCWPQQQNVETQIFYA